ncbi:MAG TPA: hypothetical protein VLE51_03285 [Candidatus Saccharimonadales bacterium]|nr:hypothetical protein [Candidatus Saccharimonadales bacterium]
MRKELASRSAPLAPDVEKKMEHQMKGAIDLTLDLSRDVPRGEDPATGIDVRTFPEPHREHIMPQYGDEKDSLVVYPAEGEPTQKLYLRTMKLGGMGSGRSERAYVDRARGGKRKGQYVYVSTDYDSKDVPDHEVTKGSETNVVVYDENGDVIREKKHQSEGVGLSPLVTKIVTEGIDAQVQKVKDSRAHKKP